MFVADSSPGLRSVQTFSLYLFSDTKHHNYMEQCSYFNQLKGHANFYVEQHCKLTVSVEVVCVNGKVSNEQIIHPTTPTEIAHSALQDLLCRDYIKHDYLMVLKEKTESIHMMFILKGGEKSFFPCTATFDPKVSSVYSSRQFFTIFTQGKPRSHVVV